MNFLDFLNNHLHKPTCEKCKFWRDDETDDVIDTGFCHRFPPALSHGRSVEHDKYPRTHKDEWCGEFHS